jgi:amino acid transporter
MDEPASKLSVEEDRLREESSVFKKELGLTDLVLTQILFIVGLPWIGVAAKQGPSHVLLWLGAIVLFYVPSAATVIYLNRQMPLEGGVYQWAKLGFTDVIGFMVAWNLWLFAILNTSEIGLQLTQYLAYVGSDSARTLAEDQWFVAATNVVVIGALVLVTIVGLSVGKWVHKFGGILMIGIFVTILVLPLLNFAKGTLTEYRPLTFELPVMSLLTFNLLGKMGFGALGGFEYVALHAGETRDAARSVGRSVMIAAPLIALMFILGTSSVLALIPQDQIDLIAPIPQILSVGLGPFGIVAGIASAATLALASIRIAQASVMFGGTTRLPMVAGWDNLLPEWFTTLHARYKTPVNSILFVGAATLFMGIVGLIGVGKQEAFQLLWNASGVFYALTYVVMFSIPIFGLKRSGMPIPMRLKIAAGSGLIMTILYVGLSVVPIVQVESRPGFALKVGGLIAAANAVGWLIYRAAKRRSVKEKR